jgi:hypothetical protein
MTLTAKRAKYTPMSQRIIFCFAVVGLFLKPQRIVVSNKS